MKTTTAILSSLLIVALLACVAVVWLARVPTDATETQSSTALGKLKRAVRSWTERIASDDTDDEILEEAVAADAGTGDLEAEDAVAVEDDDEGEEDLEPASSTLQQPATEDTLRRDIGREISRRRRATYKELRPLEQKIFRLKNESSGLVPHKPSPSASAETWRRYRDAVAAYEASNRRIVGEMRQAVAARDRVAAVYGKLKQDSSLAARCASGDLLGLAREYGVQQAAPQAAGEN